MATENREKELREEEKLEGEAEDREQEDEGNGEVEGVDNLGAAPVVKVVKVVVVK